MATSKKAGFNLRQIVDQSSLTMGAYSSNLPETPTIRIRANKSWTIINPGELWAHRELLFFLVWRDLKVRYKQTVLGTSWIILQPVLMTLVFAIFLGNVFRVSTNGIPYLLFLYSGLLPWIFFSNAVSSSSYSLIASANMITKVYFPRSLVPIAAVLVRLSDFLVASVVLVLLMLYYGQMPTWRILMAPLFIVQLALLATALSLWTSALNVKYRDVGSVLPVVLQLWMFISPIIYPANMIGPKWQWLYDLNPLTGIVGGFRSALFGTQLEQRSLTLSVIATLLLLVYAAFTFRRMEVDFADVV